MKKVKCSCGITHDKPKAVYADGHVVLVKGCCLP